MKFLSIKDAMEEGKGTVSVRGWVHRERGSSKMKFVILRDSTGIIQCVIEKSNVGPDMFEIADKLQIEASLEITGEIKKDDRAQGGYEIYVQEFRVVGESDKFPIGKDQSREFLDDNRHLWLRSRKMSAIMKIRSTVLKYMRKHWTKKGFYEYQSPILMGLNCEGGSTLFEVDYYGDKVYLAQTWQLHAEPAIFALEKIFSIQPAFRAEKSKTSRHLSELWMAEMEAAWYDFDMLQDDAEELFKYVVKKVLKNNAEELKILGRDTAKLKPTVDKPWPRLTYNEVLELLKNKFDMEVPWGKDLRTIEEDKLSEVYDTPVIVTRYPKVVKAFYMKEDPQDPKVVLGFDIIGTEHYGELAGASVREESIEKLIENLVAQGEDPEKYEFYFDTRKYGSVPHGGYGVGVERIISWICGLDNIKDAIAFPRTITRFKP